jgi:hypothetical protein
MAQTSGQIKPRENCRRYGVFSKATLFDLYQRCLPDIWYINDVTMTTKNKRPFICEYYDYRRFLADLFTYHKSISSVFSHRYIVDKAGLKSPNVLNNVMVGKR